MTDRTTILGFAHGVVSRCLLKSCEAVVFLEGGKPRAAYSCSDSYEVMRDSVQVFGTYDSKADPADIAADVEAQIKAVAEVEAERLAAIDSKYSGLVDDLLLNLQRVPADRLALLKRALQPFNIQKGRFM